MNKQLGWLSEKYESGGAGPGTISSGHGDPGGVSYGTYQLSSNAGTLERFINSMGYSDDFKDLDPGTNDFNYKWRELAQDPHFALDQWQFIKKTHYDPAKKFAIDDNYPENDALNNVIWSMAVQHGKVNAILLIVNVYQPIKNIIIDLYKARTNYIKNLGLGQRVTQSLINRYVNEQEDALEYLQEIS